MNDTPLPRMFFAIMYHPRGTSDSLTSSYTDPLSMNPWYKGTRVGILVFGGTIPELLRTTSFLPNNKLTRAIRAAGELVMSAAVRRR